MGRVASARDLETLTFRQRQRRSREVPLAEEAKPFKNRFGVLARRAHVACAQECTDRDIVQHRKRGERLDNLERAGNPGGTRSICAQAIDALRVEVNVTAVGGQRAGYDIEQSGFAGAVWSDQRGNDARFKFERDCCQRASRETIC